MNRQHTFMTAALQEAKHAQDQGEVPVGAVIVKDDVIIARAFNRIVALRDPTAHAEILAIQKAAQFLSYERLIDCDMYVTLEPCAMCAGAISLARLRKIFFGALDFKGGAVLHGPKFFNQPTCHHRPEIEPGVLSAPCGDILKTFFQQLRQTKNETL